MTKRSSVILAWILCAAVSAWPQVTTPPERAVADSLPPLVNRATAAPVDLRSNMVWVEGRTVSWTMPDAAGRKAKTPEANRTSPGFYMDRTEVTNRQFAQFLSAVDSPAVFYDPRMDIVEMEPHRYLSRSGAEDLPVAWTDWMAAYRFASWAGKSLPTEDEWMIAALSGRELRGNGELVAISDSLSSDPQCNSLKTGGYPGRIAVASFPQGKTSSGIYDLAGNVAEWTTTEVKSPLSGGGSASWIVVKGGSYLDSPNSMTVKGRTLHLRSERLSSVGFRCILRAPHTP